MRGSVGDQPAADQPVAAIGTDVVLVAELGDRQVDHRRLALGDFAEALAALVGPDASGLSAATISRLKEATF
jgi:hypothetical protein